MHYASAYLSGYNAYNPSSEVQNIRRELDWEGIQAWLEKWCTENPLSMFAVALHRLVLTLEANR